MNTNCILIVDDEPSYLTLLKSLLNDEGYKEVITEQNPLRVSSILQKREVDLIISDIYMPQMSGLELLEKISLSHPQIPFIIVTGVDDTDVALKAIKLGAYEFITKPPDTDRLFLTIRRALEQRLLELERDSLRNLPDKKSINKKHFEDIITESELMYKVFELVEIFAPTNETVLILGETGTGKDLIAKKIHDLSPRRNKPFVAVNLAAISSNLFESELFGHEKGSFTGAASEKNGYFEAANGGTIFLDEIGELPTELQGKLLRTIQYNEIYRIGNPKPIKLDIRIITATNKDLIKAVKENNFRADLYYRLNRGFIQLPPLRSRNNDVIQLAEHFLKIVNRTYNKHVPGFSKEILNALRKYDYPGNIRELENLVLNSVAISKDNELITDIELPKNLLEEEKRSTGEDKLITLNEAVKEHIKYVLKTTEGNIQKAAGILGISERTLQRRLQKMRGK